MLPAKLSQWLSTNGLKVEISLVVLILISVVLKHAGYQDIVSPLMILMFTLAAYYFLSAYMPPTLKGLPGIIAIKVHSISMSICVIGLLYTILHWYGSLNILLIGSVTASIAGLIFLVNWLKTRETNLLPILMRTIIVGGSAVAAFITLRNAQGF